MTLTPKKLCVRVLAATLLLVAVLLICLQIGSVSVSLRDVLRGPSYDGQTNIAFEIIVKYRLPRILLAAIIGAALAGSGCVFQAILRNPLADPYILGISSGAGLGTLAAVLLGWSWTFLGMSAMMLTAFAGALATTWLVWLIGRVAGRTNITGLLLAGVVVNAFFSSMIMFLTSIACAHQVQTTMLWLMGSISEMQRFEVVAASGLLVTIGIAALVRLGPSLNLLSFGAEDATSLGLSVTGTYMTAFAISALITSVAVCVGGLVGFVGLVVPHAVRLTAGPDHRQLIPVSAIVGAAFVVAADTLARIVVAPAMLPVGVVTAMAGGPFFLLLLVRYTKKVYWGAK
jgi:iron complex transport system permease protein